MGKGMDSKKSDKNEPTKTLKRVNSLNLYSGGKHMTI